MRHSRANRLAALLLLCLIAVIPMVVHHFHNHDDAGVHHDCPVYQWESGFLSTFTLLFILIVVPHAVRFIVMPEVAAVPVASRHIFQRRAPPIRHSR